jgi:hypothetical protein
MPGEHVKQHEVHFKLHAAELPVKNKASFSILAYDMHWTCALTLQQKAVHCIQCFHMHGTLDDRMCGDSALPGTAPNRLAAAGAHNGAHSGRG